MITTEQVKELRDKTGISIMQCKRALEECGGDMEKALMILKKKSSELAEKKSDRETHEGAVLAKQSGNKVVILTLHCETDFVAKNEDFVSLANALADTALTDGVDTLKQKAADMINPVLQKTGENIVLGDVEVIEGTTIGSYLHNGKSGVVVTLEGGTAELAKDVAMHIAAMRPEFTTKEEIPLEQKTRAKELFEKEVATSDKPEEMKVKILQGKIDAYFKDLTLLDQAFIKDGNMTVGALLTKNNAKIVKTVRQAI